jgi:hypothetical protein
MHAKVNKPPRGDRRVLGPLVVSVIGSVLAAILLASWGILGEAANAAFLYLDKNVTTFRLLLIFTLLALVVAYWPRARQIFARPFYESVVQSVRAILVRGFDETGELASSVVVFHKRQDKQGVSRYYCLLEWKRVENARYDGPGGIVPMYPGKRVQIFERPDTSALRYVRENLGLNNLTLSPNHHDITEEQEYPRTTTTQVPCPFKVLLERQPQRGPQAYNYDLIYVGLCSNSNPEKLPELPANCQWRVVEDVREGAFDDMLDDVRAVILEAAEKLP